MDRIDEALAADATPCSAADYYGAPSEYPDCPMPDWLKRRLGLPPDERLVREAVEAMQAAAMGYRTAPTMEVVARGLADGADAADVLMAFSRLLAPRSRCQAMAGWVAGAYTPRQAVARAVEHGYKLRGLRDQLRCLRVRGFAAEEVFESWGLDPGEPVVKLPERVRTLYLRERDLIDTWTAAAGLGPEQVAVGGGSVLAARWGHRASDDVDVVVQGATAYKQMLGEQQRLDALARRRGGRRVVGAAPSCGSDNVEDRGYGRVGQARVLCRVGESAWVRGAYAGSGRSADEDTRYPADSMGQARSLSAPFCSQGYLRYPGGRQA